MMRVLIPDQNNGRVSRGRGKIPLNSGVLSAAPGLILSVTYVEEGGAQGVTVGTFTPTYASNPGDVSLSNLFLAGAFQMNADGVTLEYGSALIEYIFATVATFTASYTDDNGTYDFDIVLSVRQVGLPVGGDISLNYVTVADETAPVLSSPAGGSAAATTFTGSVVTDEAGGSLYYVVYLDTATLPSAAQIIAGTDGDDLAGVVASSKAVSAVGTQNVSGGGLTGSTDYQIAYAQVNRALLISNAVETASFTTAAGPGDVTAPVLTSPIGTKTGITTADGGVTTDEDNGTLYMVTTTSATKPSAAQAKAGQDHTGAAAAFAANQSITTTGAKTFSVTGLTAATTYYNHYMQEDDATNQSTVATSASFTTDAAAVTVSGHVSLPTNLVSYWRLEEASGTRADAAGSNDLTDNGTVTQVSGKQGNAAEFVRANGGEFLSIANGAQSGLGFTGSFSVNGWVNMTSPPANGDVHWLLSKITVSGNQRAYGVGYFQELSTLKIGANLSPTGTTFDTPRIDHDLGTGTWHMLSYVYDAPAGSIEFFVDGSSIGSVGSILTSLKNSTAPVKIGSSNTNTSGQLFDGLIDEVGVWDRKLTSGEITALYASGAGIPYL